MFDNALLLAFRPLCHRIEGPSHGTTPSSSTQIVDLATAPSLNLCHDTWSRLARNGMNNENTQYFTTVNFTRRDLATRWSAFCSIVSSTKRVN